MSKQTKALKLALDALEEINKLSIGENAICLPAEIDTAMDAIREALAEQPAQDDPDLQDKDPELVEQHYKQVVDGVRKVFDAKRKQQPAQQQEPVAVVSSVVNSGDKGVRVRWLGGFPQIGDPLYTSPPASKPLTDEEIMEMYNEPRSDAEMIAFARAIEAAHGIGEQN